MSWWVQRLPTSNNVEEATVEAAGGVEFPLCWEDIVEFGPPQEGTGQFTVAFPIWANVYLLFPENIFALYCLQQFSVHGSSLCSH